MNDDAHVSFYRAQGHLGQDQEVEVVVVVGGSNYLLLSGLSHVTQDSWVRQQQNHSPAYDDHWDAEVGGRQVSRLQVEKHQD